MWTDYVCRSSNFSWWDTSSSSFNDCFIDVLLLGPFHVLFAFISAYCWGSLVSSSRPGFHVGHRCLRKGTLILRLLLALSIALVCLCQDVLWLREHDWTLPETGDMYSAGLVVPFAWMVHSMYLLRLFQSQRASNGKPVLLCSGVFLVILSNAIKLQRLIVVSYRVRSPTVDLIIVIVVLALSVVYAVAALLQMCFNAFNPYCVFIDQDDEMLYMSGSFHEEIEGEEDANILSKLSLYWVNNLMKKGVQSQLKSASDVFPLPTPLTSRVVHEEVSLIIDRLGSYQNIKLWNLLLVTFGKQFIGIGLLRFLADLLGFAGPILLSSIVLYLEDTRKPSVRGFYYAIGLCLSTVVASFSITLFNFYITNVSLKIRSSIIFLIYQKLFRVRLRTLLNSFSSGEILNFSSTDTDRITNFCPSILQLLSLPVQLAISLYLLHTQLGLAFLAGLLFAVLILPVNKYVCDKIGDLSTRMMKHKDERIKLMTEILIGFRVVKMHAWEEHFYKKVQEIRLKEMKYLKKRKYLDAICVYLWATTPVIISCLSFTAYVLMGNTLTSAKVFTSLALFSMLIMPLNALPWVLNGVVEAWVSIKRIQKFFLLHEIEKTDHYNHSTEGDTKIFADEVYFEQDAPSGCVNHMGFILGPLNLQVRNGAFIGVIGQVGSGKSSVLSGLIGEMHRMSGSLGFCVTDLLRGIGYVSQEPFIQNGTIRDNILFGKPYEYKRYAEVLDACALFPDLDTFVNGDNSLVGDRGVTLSGGQKSRIALARALYQNFDLYLLDDIYSSVDVHVAEHITNKCIQGFLRNKTKIVCTHHVEFLAQADLIVVLKDGRVIESGPPSAILKSKLCEELQKPEDSSSSATVEGRLAQKEPDEEKAEGVVKFSVYNTYLKAVGYYLTFFVILSFILMQGSRTFSDWWLAYWTSVSNEHKPGYSSITFLKYFAGIAIINSAMTLLRAFLFAIGGIVAAVAVHNTLLKSVLSFTVRFFDLKSFGLTINRFSTDMFNIDDALPFTLNIFLSQVFGLMASLAITIYGLPWIMVLVFLLMFPYYYIQWYYRWTSRDLKRLCAITLAPIYSQFAETLHGLATIRAFAGVDRFISEFCQKLDINNATQYSSNAASQWLNLRLQLLGAIVTSGVAFMAISLHYSAYRKVEAGFVGLALAYSLSITGLLNGVVQTFTQVETDMVSIERVRQCTDDPEKEPEDGISPNNWPSDGKLVYNSVSMKYREELPLVLSNVSFTIKPRQFVGVVGRTGSGKSSLLQCLFRLVKPVSGSICIDDVDIGEVNLKSLRSNLFIIPQDSFLFSGTVRENVDPFKVHSDGEIWKVLRSCQIESLVLTLGGLGVNLTESGQDLSVGQKQLLCLARALLSRAKIICLDEATASVDSKTDAIIQESLRHTLKHSTVLLIAHKIDSVINCDTVIVMDSGKVVESGPPKLLVENKTSAFYKMWSSAEH